MTEVWITGCGAVTAAGPASPDLGDAVLSGRSAIRPLPDVGCVQGGQVDLAPDGRSGRRLDRVARLFMTAADEAWRDAGFDGNSFPPDRTGVFEGSALGPLSAILRTCRAETGRARAARPLDLLRLMPGAGGTRFAQRSGICGPVLQITAGSVSAACAIGEAYEKLRAGSLDVAVAGGTECPFDSSIVERFRLAGVICPSPSEACLPFDRRRCGTVLGEGAGVVVLESRRHAERRGARPRAVFDAYALASEAYSPFAPDPNGTGVAQVTKRILHDNPEPGWIKAHAPGTPSGDLAEYQGLASTFGRHLPLIPVTSLKPIVGHCLGASGAIEAVAAILALEARVVPPTINTTCVDPSLPLYSVALESRPCTRLSALLLSESFGGRCAALLVHAAR